MGAKSVFVALTGVMRPLFILGVLVLPAACAGASPTPTASRPDGDAAGRPAPDARTHQPTASRQAPRGGDAGEGAIQTPPGTAPVPTALTPQDGEQPSGGHPKLGSALNGLLAAYRQNGMPGAQSYARTHSMVLDEGRVQVELVLAEGAADDVIAQVEAAGGEVQAHYGTRLQALAPLEALESLAERPDMQVIWEPRRATP